MTFTYRLLGKDSKLDISVEPRNMNREQIWLVKDPQEDTVWKTGKVSLGLVTEFRVNKYFPSLQSVNVHVLLHFVARDRITWKPLKLFVTSGKPGLFWSTIILLPPPPSPPFSVNYTGKLHTSSRKVCTASWYRNFLET